MKKIIISVIFVFAFFTLFSQNDTMLRINSTYTIIKLVPLSLFEPTPFMEFACEFPLIHGKSTFQSDLGYMLSWNQMGNELFSGKNKGFRTRLEYRKYFSFTRNSGAYYFGPEIFYKLHITEDEKQFSRFDGAFRQWIDFKKTKQVLGAHFKMGFQKFYMESRFVFDIYAGFGFRNINIKNDLPEDVVNDALFAERAPGNYTMPSLTGGIKIGLIIR